MLIKFRSLLYLLPQNIKNSTSFESSLQRHHLTTSVSHSTALKEEPKSFTAAMTEALDKFAAEKEAGAIQLAAEKKAEKDPLLQTARSLRVQMKKRKWVDFNVLNPEESAKRANFEPSERIKRKKTAILLAYSGSNYYGMQRNPGMKTIEEELFKAMLKQKWITDDSFEQVQNVCFQRAARTDKGVSAARQVCSVKLRKLIAGNKSYFTRLFRDYK